MNTIQFGDRIRQMRLYRRMSQAELARLVGVDRSQMCRYEGGSVPDAMRLIRICEALNCCLTALTGPHPNGFDPRRCALEKKHLWEKMDGAESKGQDEPTDEAP